MKIKNRVLLIIILCFVMVFTTGCENMNEKKVELAVDNTTAELEAAMKQGCINYYKIIEATDYVSEHAKDVSYSEKERKANVKIVYEIRLGENDDEKGLITISRKSHVYSNAQGRLVEDPTLSSYTEKDFHREGGIYDSTCAGLNSTPWNGKTAKLIKDKNSDYSLSEIANILFIRWLEDFSEWGDNSFIIIDKMQASIGEPIPAFDNEVFGYTKKDIELPDSKNTWLVSVCCGFKILGIGPSLGDEIGGGRAFGNDGLWIDSGYFMNPANNFVLTEWDDCYTFDTVYKIKNYKNSNQ